jgi:hypothetical protein
MTLNDLPNYDESVRVLPAGYRFQIQDRTIRIPQYWAVLPFLVLSVCAWIFMFTGSGAAFRSDPELVMEPMYCIMIWASVSIIIFVLLVLQNLGVGSINWDQCLMCSAIFFFGCWVWGWIIIGDPETWSRMREKYYRIYVISILYQILNIVILLMDGAVDHYTTENIVVERIETEV